MAELGYVDTVYDRAALTALPEVIRKHYVSHLRLLVPEAAKVFLLTTEDAEEKETLSQAFGIAEEIKILYSEDFDIELTHVESVFEVDPESPNKLPERTEYKVYRLTAKLY